jgi:hypothetical protein
MIQLTKEEIQNIEAEAKKLYPDIDHDLYEPGDADYEEMMWAVLKQRDAYIAGATSRAIKAKELEAGLRKISEQHTCKEQRDDPEGNGDIGDVEYGYDAIIELVRETLLNYNKP